MHKINTEYLSCIAAPLDNPNNLQNSVS